MQQGLLAAWQPAFAARFEAAIICLQQGPLQSAVHCWWLGCNALLVAGCNALLVAAQQQEATSEHPLWSGAWRRCAAA
jgi:hypothetical protein